MSAHSTTPSLSGVPALTSEDCMRPSCALRGPQRNGERRRSRLPAPHLTPATAGARVVAQCLPMAFKEPSFTIGIEEEHLLVDRTTLDLVREMPQALFEGCERALRGRVAREFLKSQIEVGTRVHKTARAAGAELRSLRRTVARLAAEHGLAPIAASTH